MIHGWRSCGSLASAVVCRRSQEATEARRLGFLVFLGFLSFRGLLAFLSSFGSLGQALVGLGRPRRLPPPSPTSPPRLGQGSLRSSERQVS